jgi:hypothetical protein
VDWESKDENLMSCLEIAKKKKHSKIVELLREKLYITQTKETLPELARKAFVLVKKKPKRVESTIQVSNAKKHFVKQQY